MAGQLRRVPSAVPLRRPGTLEQMLWLCGQHYGWDDFARIACHKLLPRLALPPARNSLDPDQPRVCSAAVCFAARSGGGLEMLQRRLDLETTPGDLAAGTGQIPVHAPGRAAVNVYVSSRGGVGDNAMLQSERQARRLYAALFVRFGGDCPRLESIQLLAAMLADEPRFAVGLDRVVQALVREKKAQRLLGSGDSSPP